MGLGLSIAKKNALLSGGDVTVIAGELGGAAFRVVAAVMTRKRHIVIVDDEPNIGRSLRLILEGEGYRVSVFESAAAFAAERRRAAADVYLLDVRLPDGNGIDLLRVVRQWDERSAAVMISGHGTIADAVAGDADRRVRLPREAARRATACCWSSRTRSSGRTCSARTSASASWSATRRG